MKIEEPYDKRSEQCPRFGGVRAAASRTPEMNELCPSKILVHESQRKLGMEREYSVKRTDQRKMAQLLYNYMF